MKDYNRVSNISSCKKALCMSSPSKKDGFDEELLNSVTPQKQLDMSGDSLREEFEEEAVEIDCGVVDPTSAPDI